MTNDTCKWVGCNQDASDEPISMYCKNHIKIVRPYEKP